MMSPECEAALLNLTAILSTICPLIMEREISPWQHGVFRKNIIRKEEWAERNDININCIGQNYQRTLFSRCSNSQQPQPLLYHHREAAEVFRLERRAHKNMIVENGPHNTTSTTHKTCYPKLITRKTVTSDLRPDKHSLMRRALIRYMLYT
jgi:hypothetical protein